jgi:predicted metal-dependent phosphoesterase TrpH
VIDLHTHSRYSDGTNSPEELVDLAVAKGLHAVALTDHDTVAGVPEFLAAAERAGIEGIPGIELSAECASGTMHILGYFFDPEDPVLTRMLDRVKQGRSSRNLEILKKLNRLGYVIRWCEVEQLAGSDIVGRPHFAEALLRRGYVKSKKLAFDLLLAKGRPAYASRYHYTAQECIAAIRGAGGLAVLAHPATLHLSPRALYNQIRELAAEGLSGIEIYYADHRPDIQKLFKTWADELGLICTGGTDFHGANSPDLSIGSGFGNLHVPDRVLEELKNRVDTLRQVSTRIR